MKGNMNKLEFATKMQARTKAFAVQIVKFFVKLPKTDEARVLGRQLLRAATSVAANYRAVCRSKSDADFISKLGTVVEETDESLFWIEVLEESGICPTSQVAVQKREADELLRILSTSLSTAKRNGR
jgi:four helix bundle protein